jgi:DNA-binding protein H-NS
MASANLASMNVQELLNLRKQVDATLAQRRTDLEKQLKDLGGLDGARVGRGARGSKLAGRTVPPKYRDKAGNVWSGRGMQPKWLVE